MEHHASYNMKTSTVTKSRPLKGFSPHPQEITVFTVIFVVSIFLFPGNAPVFPTFPLFWETQSTFASLAIWCFPLWPSPGMTGENPGRTKKFLSKMCSKAAFGGSLYDTNPNFMHNFSGKSLKLCICHGWIPPKGEIQEPWQMRTSC